MRRSPLIPLLAVGMLSALLAGGEAPAPEEVPPAATTSSDPTPAPALPAEPRGAPEITPAPVGAAELTVYKDPVTGRLMPIPAAELRNLLTEDLRRAASMSHEGLVETAAPGGGVMVNLQGRFRSVMVATVGPDGVVTAGCDQGDLDRKE